MVWDSGEDTTVTGIGNYWDGRTTGYGAAIPGTVNGWTNQVSPNLGPDDYVSNVDETFEGWTGGGSLKVEHRFNDLTLMALSAYRKGQFRINRDLDFSPQPQASLKLFQTDEQFSQEFQLSSAANSRLKWTTGLYYFNLKSAYPDILVDLSNSVNLIALTSKSTQRAKSVAAYAQGTYEIFDRTNLTLGGRYTQERRKEEDSRTTVDFVGIPFLGIPPSTTLIVPPDSKFTDENFTYRVSLDHRFTEQLLAYASVNTGFKSGGYNTNNPGSPPFNPETLTAYEVGFKSDLLDQRLRVNLAGFYYDYKDMQVQRVATGALQIINGPKSRIYGVDADFTAVFSPEFSVTGGFAWLDTKFKNFEPPKGCPEGRLDPNGIVAIPVNENGNCSGNQVPFAADFTGSLAANYTKDLGPGSLLMSANVYYNGGYFSGPDNVIKSDSYSLFNATLKWAARAGYSVALEGRNLTDKRAFLGGGSQTNGTFTGGYVEPRRVSVVFEYQF